MRLPGQWRETRCGLAAIFLLACLKASAQTATLSGRVVDSESREALPFTNVFVNNTTIGTAADANGAFRLSGIPAGPGEIVFSFVGYQLFKLRVDLKPGQIMQTEVRLIADGKILENVKVEGKRDKVWENQFKRFTRTFLGSGKRADQCKILNPWALEFKEDGKNLAAEARQVLEIENNSLGYKIFYALKKFNTDGQSYAIIGDGRFETMKPADEKIAEAWNRNRLNAYLGSQRHLMRAILTNTIRRESFRLYADKIGFENSPKYAVFARELGRSIETFDTTRVRIIKGTSVNSVQISLPRKLEVHYVAGVSRIASYDDVIYPVSWLELRNGIVKVNSAGIVLDPENIVASGYIASLRMADMLPNDYQPSRDEVACHVVVRPSTRSFEKTYVHTDKPYYYPGERIWFKAYMNYYFQPVRDSLSTVLHVELINPARQTIAEKTLRLDSGLASHNFILPDTLRAGNYFIRAYTQFQRNFGDANLLLKAIPVLKGTTKPEYVKDQPEAPDKMVVTTSKSSYGKREKVTLALKLDDDESGPVAGNFSISVTDASQVMNVERTTDIREKFPIRDDEVSKIADKTWPVEYGVTLRGQFLNAKGKGERTSLNVIQFSPNQFMSTTTDAQGFFELTDLHFYGPGYFSFQSGKSPKARMTGTVKLVPASKPLLPEKLPENRISVVDMNAVQRIFSVYEKPSDSKMLKEVEIKGKREDAALSNVVSIARPYGVPEYVFDESRVKTQFPNLLYTLQALNIAGLVVNPPDNAVYFVRNTKPKLIRTNDISDAEIEKSYTPLVVLDGMPIMGSAGEALSIIDPSTVASIEVSKKQSSLRGTLAPYGVIAVYTKKKLLTDEQPSNINLTTLEGYAMPEQFVHPNYDYSSPEHSSPDYRSTLYWNPNVSIDSSGSPAEVSFHTSDLTGTYRVVVEGVNGNGEPVRSVTFIKVDEKW